MLKMMKQPVPSVRAGQSAQEKTGGGWRNEPRDAAPPNGGAHRAGKERQRSQGGRRIVMQSMRRAHEARNRVEKPPMDRILDPCECEHTCAEGEEGGGRRRPELHTKNEQHRGQREIRDVRQPIVHSAFRQRIERVQKCAAPPYYVTHALRAKWRRHEIATLHC